MSKGIVLVDTREKENKHILVELDKLGIQYKKKKLNYGDYSFEINGRSYEREIAIERKASLDEIVGNFTKGRKRFRNEFERSKGCKLYLIIESSLDQLEKHEYRSIMSPKDLKRFLKTWCSKYQLRLIFIDKKSFCSNMIDLFKKYLKEIKTNE